MKMTSQLVIFRAFLFIFFRPPTLDLKKISRKSTNKKNLALLPHFHPYPANHYCPFMLSAATYTIDLDMEILFAQNFNYFLTH